LITTLSAAMLAGFLPVLLRSLREPLSGHLKLTPDEAARLEKWFVLTMVAALAAGGWAADRWGEQVILFAGAVLAAMGTATLGLRTTYAALIPSAGMLGIAAALITVGSIRLMPAALWGIDEPSASTSLGFVAVGLGALLLPPMAEFLWRRLDFRRSMLWVGCACLLPAAFAVFTPTSDFPKVPQVAEFQAVLAEPRWWFVLLIGLLYFPLEALLAVSAQRFLGDQGYNPAQVTRWLTRYWLLFLAGRLAIGLILVEGNEYWLMFFCLLLSAVTIGNLIGAYSPAGAWGWLVIAGCHGPLMPMFLGTTFVLFGSQAPATALGLVLAASTASSGLLRGALWVLGSNLSGRATLVIALVLALLSAAASLALALIRHL
jgi:MFS family permease